MSNCGIFSSILMKVFSSLLFVMVLLFVVVAEEVWSCIHHVHSPRRESRRAAQVVAHFDVRRRTEVLNQRLSLGPEPGGLSRDLGRKKTEQVISPDTTRDMGLPYIPIQSYTCIDPSGTTTPTDRHIWPHVLCLGDARPRLDSNMCRSASFWVKNDGASAQYVEVFLDVSSAPGANRTIYVFPTGESAGPDQRLLLSLSARMKLRRPLRSYSLDYLHTLGEHVRPVESNTLAALACVIPCGSLPRFRGKNPVCAVFVAGPVESQHT